MIVSRLVLIVALATLTATAQQTSSESSSNQKEPVPPVSCTVTRRPAFPHIAPADYHQDDVPEHVFLIGSDNLWTSILDSMVWQWRPRTREDGKDLTRKVFWFRVGYSRRLEPIPKIKVTGRRLDGPAPPLMLPQGPATNVIGDDSGRGAMLTGVYVPTPGCWEITGDYEGDKLSFVVWVAPAKQETGTARPLQLRK